MSLLACDAEQPCTGAYVCVVHQAEARRAALGLRTVVVVLDFQEVVATMLARLRLPHEGAEWFVDPAKGKLILHLTVPAEAPFPDVPS